MLEINPRGTWSIGPALMACSILVLGVPERASAQQPYERIVVFGTSLSDSGNGFVLVGRNNTPPNYQVDDLLVPGLPYARGGHHLSNGATWVEQFARPLGLAGTVRPALRGSGNATNYSVGAARARDNAGTFNLSDQVNTFLQEFGGIAPSGALYVIEMGGNDIRDALLAGPNGVVIIQAAVQSIAQNIATLHAAGATHFLVWTAPDVGLTPAVRALGDVAAALATQATVAFNSALEAALLQLAPLPGIQIATLDAFQLIHAIVANPSGFGLTDVTNACITPGVPPFTCQNPDGFLFWDGIHPTRAVHEIIAQEAASVLALQ